VVIKSVLSTYKAYMHTMIELKKYT